MDKQAENSSGVQMGDDLLNQTRHLKEYEDNIVDRLSSLKDHLQEGDQVIAQNCKELRQLEKDGNETYHALLVETNNKDNACTHIHKNVEQAQAIDQTLAVVSEQILQHTNAFQMGIKTNLQRLENEVKCKENLQKTEILSLKQDIENLLISDEQAQRLFDEQTDKVNEKISALQAQAKAEYEQGVNLLARIADAQIQYENLENDMKLYDELHSKLEHANERMAEEIKATLDKQLAIKNRLQKKELEKKNVDEVELKIKESVAKIQQEIADVHMRNECLKQHEIYKIVEDETEHYNVKVNTLDQGLRSVGRTLAKVEENSRKISEEVERFNAQVEQYQFNNTDLKEKIAQLKEADAKKDIEKANYAIELLNNESVALNLEIVKLRIAIQELESTTSEMMPLNIEDADAIYQKNDEINKAIADNEDNANTKKRQYLEKIENEIAADEQETTAKLAQLDEEMKTVKSLINELLIEKKNIEYEYEGKLLECDVFNKKVKDAEKEIVNLKLAVEPRKSPQPPKRTNEDDFDSDASSYKNLSSFQEMLNYKKKKLAAKKRNEK